MRPLQLLLIHRREWWKPLLLDLSFLFLFGVVAIPIRNSIGNHLTAFADSFITNPEVLDTSALASIFGLYLALIVIGTLIFIGLHGTLWRIAHLWRDVKPITYQRFALQSILWAVLLAFVVVLDFGLSYADDLAQASGQTSYLSAIVWPVYLYLGWAAALGYRNKRLPRLRDHRHGWPVLLAIIGLVAVITLVNLLNIIHPWAMYIGGALLYPLAMMGVRLT